MGQLAQCLEQGIDPAACAEKFEICDQPPDPNDPPNCMGQYAECLEQGIEPAVCDEKLQICNQP
jgi:hypothetical protein